MSKLIEKIIFKVATIAFIFIWYLLLQFETLKALLVAFCKFVVFLGVFVVFLIALTLWRKFLIFCSKLCSMCCKNFP